MSETPFELVSDYLRCIRVLREFSMEDETINGCMLIAKSVEYTILKNPTWFDDFLKVMEKYRVEIAKKHHGNIPIAYYYERWLNVGDCKEFV